MLIDIPAITIPKGYVVDPLVNFKVSENRWYVKLWFFITFRKCPNREFTAYIKSCNGVPFATITED